MEPTEETEIEFTLPAENGKALLDLLNEHNIAAKQKTIRSFDGEETLWKIVVTAGGHVAKKLIDGLQELIAKLFQRNKPTCETEEAIVSEENTALVSFTIINGETRLTVENAPVSELRHAIEKVAEQR